MRSSVLLRGTASDVLRDSTARRHSHSNLLRGLARDLLRGRAVLLLVSSCERGKLRALLLDEAVCAAESATGDGTTLDLDGFGLREDDVVAIVTALSAENSWIISLNLDENSK